jgi:TraM recognition site of TraD and TraG
MLKCFLSLAMADLPAFHPMTVLRDWSSISPGAAFRLIDAQTHILCTGSTGSGKSSGPLRHIALAYLAHGFGGVVLCSKPDERTMWEQWAEEAGRWDRAKQTGDLVIFDASGKWRFNFLDEEARRASTEGGGLTINIVALLDEIAGAIASGAGNAAEGVAGGDTKFFEDALHHMNTNLVDLPLFAGLPISLPLMRAIANTAPQSLAQAESDAWKQGPGECAALLRAADQATAGGNEDARADYEECRAYWTQEFPNLSDRTRSIITLSFSMLVRPFITRPLRRLFSANTTIKPEDTFDGKIIIVDLPVQQYRLAGRVANLVWKYCFQVASLRRTQPTNGSYLRPVVLWADEYQTFTSAFDPEWAAVARSASACACFAVQNRESLIRVLGNAATVDSLLGNLQCVFACQNSSSSSNEYMSKLIGEQWRPVISISAGRSNPQALEADPTLTSGVMSSEQRRFFVEPARFTTLKRGGPKHGHQVECIVYNGGAKFQGVDDDGRPALLPYALLTFNQRG